MTPQEFRLMRTAMGIETQDIVRELNVRKRTVNQWDFDRVAPEGVQQWLEGKWELFLQRVNEGVDLIAANPDKPLILYRGNAESTARQKMTARQHRHLAATIFLQCELEGVEVDLVDAPLSE